MDQPQHQRSTKTALLAAVFLVGTLVGGALGGTVGILGVQGRLGSFFKDKTPVSTGSVKSNVSVEEESATIGVVDTVLPSVVSVVVYQERTARQTNPFQDFFSNPFFDFQQEEQAPTGKTQVGAGTGFIVAEDGLILTNKHVIDFRDATYEVVLNDGTTYDATVLASDPFNDLAALKVDAKDLPAVTFGDSDSLKLGETVIAIGNALELQNTVTKGVVSGINRRIEAGDGQGQSEVIEGAIQTDAAINPGNSGGPLINLAGQVVGVNTAMNQAGQTIGFAIPASLARQVVSSVVENGKIVRPYLGVRYALVTEDLKKQNDLSVDYGALIVRNSASELAVIPGSPADKAGLEENDIILEFDGKRIDEEHSLASAIQKFSVGDVVTLKILHDGDEKTVQVTLEEYQAT